MAASRKGRPEPLGLKPTCLWWQDTRSVSERTLPPLSIGLVNADNVKAALDATKDARRKFQSRNAPDVLNRRIS
jgi:hypothetical protein